MCEENITALRAGELSSENTNHQMAQAFHKKKKNLILLKALSPNPSGAPDAAVLIPLKYLQKSSWKSKSVECNMFTVI